MARPLRILFEGAYYHIINRGQGKQDIFCCDHDYKRFEIILRQACETYKVELVSYCLMSNHYHLLIHTPQANLPSFMRQVNGVYTQHFNYRYSHDGPLFKGRYKAIVVQEGTYLLRLIRYIHKNPVRAGIVKTAKEYSYSSQHYYVKWQEYDWLKYKDVLKTQWKKNIRKEYECFMLQSEEEANEYLSEKSVDSVWSVIFGDQEYQDQISKEYINAEKLYGEIPEGRRVVEEQLVKIIKEKVISLFKISESELYASNRGKENLGRMMAISLLRECGGVKYKRIGELFGGLSYKSAAKYYERMKKRCEQDRKINNLYKRLKHTCSQVET